MCHAGWRGGCRGAIAELVREPITVEATHARRGRSSRPAAHEAEAMLCRSRGQDSARLLPEHPPCDQVGRCGQQYIKKYTQHTLAVVQSGRGRLCPVFIYIHTIYPETNEGGVLHGFRWGYVYYGSIYIVKRVVFCGVSDGGTPNPGVHLFRDT